MSVVKGKDAGRVRIDIGSETVVGRGSTGGVREIPFDELAAYVGVVGTLYPVTRSFSGWTFSGAIGQYDVIYERLFLPAGTFVAMETVVTLASAGQTLDMGVYADDGEESPSPDGPLLASTGPISVTGQGNSVFSQPFASPLVVPTGGGWYWLAIVSSSAAIRLTLSGTYNQAWRERLFASQSGTGSPNLPASVGALDAAASSALVYLSIEKNG